MPVPTSSRQHRYFSPPTIAATPSRANHNRTPSINASSYSPTITPAGQTKLNVVTRVAVEGKAKHGQDGVSIRMYLKISLPLDSVVPGQTIPLFPEESVKVLTSQVHPLNHKSVPYNFSSTISPMLNTAAKALNLPARSMESFQSAFHLPLSPEIPTITASTRTQRTNGNPSSSEIIPPVDVHYTGHILVSHYSVSFVLPKVFPSVNSDNRLSDNEETEGISSRQRVSIGEKNYAQFMAAIDMWVPFVCKPPRAPYLLSIPTPRCLHNHIKLRIFPPSNASASFASLSSVEEDVNYWHLTSDPHVTRNAPSRPSRTQSITHFADDETSDSSATGFADGCGIQGTFPSTENIRIRWAKPLKTIDVPGGVQDSRRRVGVNDVKGEMVCIVRGKANDPGRSNTEGLIVSLEYKGTCKGVWFPGVATLLGMDVSLEAKGSELSWVAGSPSEWTINGGTGYTGFNVGPLQNTALLESHLPEVVDPFPKDEQVLRPEGRTSGVTSSSSLLRAPLPAQTVADYSFEGSAITASSSMSLSSTSAQQPERIRPPSSPITLHVNVNEFLPPAKNVFTFTISGNVLVTPKGSARMNSGRGSSSSTPPQDDLVDPAPLVIPRFTVLAADSESTSFIIRNEVDSITANLEVYNLTGDIYRDAQTRKTVLQKGGFTRCGEDGGRIGLKSIVGAHEHSTTSRSRAPNGNILPRALSNQSLRKRDSPLAVSSVLAVVTPFQTDNKERITYAVRIRLSNSVSADTGCLEFGLAQPSPSFGVLNVLIAGVSIGGVPVKFESTASFQHQQDSVSAPCVPFEDIRAKKWVSWVKAHVAPSDDGEVVVDYVVSGDAYPPFHQRKGKRRARDDVDLQVLLPTFSVPVGRLEVNVDPMSGLDIALRSNLRHRQDSRLLHYSMEEHFDPQVTLTLRWTSIAQTSSLTVFGWFLIITWLLFFLGIIGNFHLRYEVKELKLHFETVSNSIASEWTDRRTQAPVTVTTTVYSTGTSSRWWFGEATVDSNTLTPTPFPSLLPFAASSQSAVTPTALTSELPRERPDFDPRELNSNSISPALEKSHWEAYSLRPFHHILPFTWPNDDIHTAVRKIFTTMETIWQLFKKVYHYPLDPP